MKKRIKGIFKKAIVFYTLFCILSSITVYANAKNKDDDRQYKNWNLEKSNWKEKTKEKLAKFGVPDDEIIKLEDDGLYELANKDIVGVDVRYYQVSSDGKVNKLNALDVKNVREKYEYKLKPDYTKFSLSLNPLDLLTINAQAARDDETSSDGYLRQIIYLAQTGTKDVYNITFTCNWLKIPENRKIDIFGVGLCSSLDVIKDPGTYNVWRKCKYYSTDNPSVVYDFGRFDLTDLTWGQGLACKVKLYEDGSVGTIKRCVMYDEYMYMTFNAKVKTPSVTTSISISGHYRHQEKTIQITPSISAISGDLGISCSYSEYMIPMTPNAYIQYDIIK